MVGGKHGIGRTSVHGEPNCLLPRVQAVVMTGPDRDEQLLRALHDQYAGPLWSFVLRLTGDRARSQDVVQETLLRAWRKPSVLDEEQGSARAWLWPGHGHARAPRSRSARAAALTEIGRASCRERV